MDREGTVWLLQCILADLPRLPGASCVGRHSQAWRSIITAIDTEEDSLHWDADQNYPYAPSLNDLKRLLDVLHPDKRAARQALADAIAEELGHR